MQKGRICMGEEQKTKRKYPPARTKKQRENQLINLALDFVEERLTNGTATAAEAIHFLKLATTKEELENEKLRSDLKVAEAKIKQIQMGETIAELYKNAITAMNTYRGNQDYEEDSYD